MSIEILDVSGMDTYEPDEDDFSLLKLFQAHTNSIFAVFKNKDASEEQIRLVIGVALASAYQAGEDSVKPKGTMQ